MWFFLAIFLMGSGSARAVEPELEDGQDLFDTLSAKSLIDFFFLGELWPESASNFLHSESNQALIQKVRPYVVELLATGNTATGIVLGFNSKNQPIILTAGHVLMYNDFELANVRRIFLDQPHGNLDGSIVDEKSHVVLPAWRGENSLTSKGWYGLSMFHPSYYVNESLIMREQKMDFGLYLMTNRTVAVDLSEDNLDEKYTVREAISAGFESPMLEPIKTARLKKNPLNRATPVGTRVLVMGVSKPSAESPPEMSVMFSNILPDTTTEKISKQYSLGLDTTTQYFLLGDFDKSMSGGGVFNELGELVGIVTKVVRDRSRRSIGVIVLDIEHILENIERLTNQPEVLKIVYDVKTLGRGFGRRCTQLFSK